MLNVVRRIELILKLLKSTARLVHSRVNRTEQVLRRPSDCPTRDRIQRPADNAAHHGNELRQDNDALLSRLCDEPKADQRPEKQADSRIFGVPIGDRCLRLADFTHSTCKARLTTIGHAQHQVTSG